MLSPASRRPYLLGEHRWSWKQETRPDDVFWGTSHVWWKGRRRCWTRGMNWRHHSIEIDLCVHRRYRSHRTSIYHYIETRHYIRSFYHRSFDLSRLSTFKGGMSTTILLCVFWVSRALKALVSRWTFHGCTLQRLNMFGNVAFFARLAACVCVCAWRHGMFYFCFVDSRSQGSSFRGWPLSTTKPRVTSSGWQRSFRQVLWCSICFWC